MQIGGSKCGRREHLLGRDRRLRQHRSSLLCRLGVDVDGKQGFKVGRYPLVPLFFKELRVGR